MLVLSMVPINSDSKKKILNNVIPLACPFLMGTSGDNQPEMLSAAMCQCINEAQVIVSAWNRKNHGKKKSGAAIIPVIFTCNCRSDAENLSRPIWIVLHKACGPTKTANPNIYSLNQIYYLSFRVKVGYIYSSPTSQKTPRKEEDSAVPIRAIINSQESKVIFPQK
ncbi:unnamed protein product [Camellia sinensis]